MAERVVTVRFSREGPREGIMLERERTYQAMVDGGPQSAFRSPWSQQELESLDDLTTVARQQAALRHARTIEKKAAMDQSNSGEHISALESESRALQELALGLEATCPRNPGQLAETYGILGSLQQRKSKLRNNPPDPEDLRKALRFYEKGIRADANSFYCGINVVHLSFRLGDSEKRDDFIPRTRFPAENAVGLGNCWAYATLGDLSVYEEDAQGAAERYREFVDAVERDNMDQASRVANFQSSRRPLAELLANFQADELAKVRHAAEAAISVLESAIRRNSR